MSDSHRDLAKGEWFTLSIAEQLGNVASEVSRAIRWAAKNRASARSALDRALDLIGLSLDDPRHRASIARLREIARAREVVIDFLDGPNQYGSTAASLQKYFDAFAVAARRDRGA